MSGNVYKEKTLSRPQVPEEELENKREPAKEEKAAREEGAQDFRKKMKKSIQKQY